MPGQHGRITLKDIARETGYTINTVSRALKNKNDISGATRELIQAAAERMGYIRDSVASSMRSGATRTIAVILGDISNPYFALQVKSIEAAAAKHGYGLFIINTDEDSDFERRAIINACGKKVDGILICPVQETDENIRFLQKTGVPFVLTGRYFKELDADAVFSDEVKSGFIAADYLLSHGFERILFLNGPLNISSAEDRREGFIKAHSKFGKTPDKKLLKTVGIKRGLGQKAVQKAFSEKLEFDAVVAFSDILGLEVKSAIYDILGQRAESIPVVGFDNILADLSLPIDFISVGIKESGWAAKAAELLIERIQKGGDGSDFKKIVLDVELVHHRLNNESLK